MDRSLQLLAHVYGVRCSDRPRAEARGHFTKPYAGQTCLPGALMKALHHAANAIRHAEALADEAEDAGLLRAGERLRDLAFEVAGHVEGALTAEEEVLPAREVRLREHSSLGAAFRESSLRLEAALGCELAVRFMPGSVLDVAERVRFVLRRLQNLVDEEGAGSDDVTARARGVAARLERRLFAYDEAVDRYLLVSGQFTAAKDRALRESHLLRRRLEEAKAQLLARLEPGTDAYQRVRSRAVRTKRARWIDAATQVAPHPQILFTTTDGSQEPLPSQA